MHEEEYVGEEGWEGQEEMDLDEAQIAAILQQYRAQQLREHMIGPVASFVVHAVALVLLSVYVVSEKPKIKHEIEVSIEEMEVKEVEEKIIEEIETTEDALADNAPQMSVPDAPSENADAALEDVSDEAPETDDDMEMEEVLDVVAHATPLKMPGLYGGRSAAGRASGVRRYGGTRGGQDAVLKALRWLAKVQLENGSWANQPAHSGLALLCFLAHGETPLSEEFGVTVQKAIQWLSNGMPEGKYWDRAYSHGIATYALAEAYGMTQIPFVREAMDNGIEVIVKGQQPGGGFDYNYKKGERWDVSVTGWQMQAMKAAYVSGCTNPGLERAMQKSLQFMKSTYKDGPFLYSSKSMHGGQLTNMTGIGTLCLQLLGQKQCREAKGGVAHIAEKRMPTYVNAAKGEWDDMAHKYNYGWYYDTQAVFQAQGPEWNAWNKLFQTVLIKNQNPEGYWTYKEKHRMGGDSTPGRVLSTTLCCLQLEVYYRYLPTFKISKENFIQADGGLADEGADAGLVIE